MSSSSNKSRENYLNNLTKKYTEKLTLKTPEEANAKLLYNINRYIDKFIEGDETLDDFNKIQRYKELYKKINSDLTKLSEWIGNDTLDNRNLIKSLRASTMPILNDIAKTVNDYGPVVEVKPVQKATILGVEKAKSKGFVDTLRGMFGMSDTNLDTNSDTTEIFTNVGELKPLNNIQEAKKFNFVGDGNNDFLTQATKISDIQPSQPLEAPPSNLSFRAGSNIRNVAPMGGGAAPEEPMGGGAAPQGFTFVGSP